MVGLEAATGRGKVAAELEYAKTPGTRWTMPSLWYRFEFPAKKPLVTVIALDSNMPHADGRPNKGADFTLTTAQQADQLTWLASELEKPACVHVLPASLVLNT